MNSKSKDDYIQRRELPPLRTFIADKPTLVGAAGPKGSNPQNRLVGNFATDHGQITNLHALNLGNKRRKREKTLSVASSISLRNSIIFLRGSNCRSKRLQTLIILMMRRSSDSTTLSG